MVVSLIPGTPSTRSMYMGGLTKTPSSAPQGYAKYALVTLVTHTGPPPSRSSYVELWLTYLVVFTALV